MRVRLNSTRVQSAEADPRLIQPETLRRGASPTSSTDLRSSQRVTTTGELSWGRTLRLANTCSSRRWIPVVAPLFGCLAGKSVWTLFVGEKEAEEVIREENLI